MSTIIPYNFKNSIVIEVIAILAKGVQDITHVTQGYKFRSVNK